MTTVSTIIRKVEYLETSRNGNSRYRVTTDAGIWNTGTDSACGYVIWDGMSPKPATLTIDGRQSIAIIDLEPESTITALTAQEKRAALRAIQDARECGCHGCLPSDWVSSRWSDRVKDYADKHKDDDTVRRFHNTEGTEIR